MADEAARSLQYEYKMVSGFPICQFSKIANIVYLFE